MTRYNGKGQKVNCIAMSNCPLYTDHRSGKTLDNMSQMFTQKRTFLVLALQKILVKAKREFSNFALFSHQFCSFECHKNHAKQMVRNNKKVSSVALIPETGMRLCGLKLTPTLGTAALVVLQQVQCPASIAD